MARWWMKAAVQGGLSVLPGSERLNERFQERVTGSLELTPERFEGKVRQARRHLRHHRRATGGGRPRTVLELGTGWYPIVPVALAIGGVRRTISFDLHPLVNGERTLAVLERFADYAARDALRPLLRRVTPRGLARLDSALAEARPGASAAELLRPLGIELRVGDARQSGLAASSIDLFVSNNTFEHIPPDVLRGLAAEFARLAAPGAVMDHFVDMHDHYADFDPRVSRLNYLRFPEHVWRLFNNRLQYQNRLRLPDYRAIVEEAGFDVVAERPSGGKPGEFEDLPVTGRFRSVPREEREALFVWLTARAQDSGSRQPPVSPR